MVKLNEHYCAYLTGPKSYERLFHNLITFKILIIIFIIQNFNTYAYYFY